MKPVTTIMLALLCLAACKKDPTTGTKAAASTSDDTTQLTDTTQVTDLTNGRGYMFVPMKDAIWLVHSQGTIVSQSPNIYDTSYHYHAVITALNQDTFVNGWHYHFFSAYSTPHHGSSVGGTVYVGRLYINEDTIGKKVYQATMFPSFGGTVLLDYNRPIGSTYQHVSQIVDSGDIPINGIPNKVWYGSSSLTGITCFFQAYGIGGQGGVTLSGFAPGGYNSQLRSLDFIYKGDTIHFDYDIDPNGSF